MPPQEHKLIYELLLAKLSAACAAHRDEPELVIAIIPGRWDVVLGEPSPITRFVLEACAAQEIKAVDLTGPLHEIWAEHPDMKKDGRPLHFAVDGHWTAAGHAAAARILHESLDWSRSATPSK